MDLKVSLSLLGFYEAIFHHKRVLCNLTTKQVHCIIHYAGLHLETHEEHKEEFLLLTEDNKYGKQILEKKFPLYHLDYIIHKSNPYHMLPIK